MTDENTGDTSINNKMLVRIESGLKITLSNPNREVEIHRAIRKDNNAVYWQIKTSLPEYGSDNDQEFIVSDEVFNRLIIARKALNERSLAKLTNTRWISRSDIENSEESSTSQGPVTFTIAVDLLEAEKSRPPST